MNPGQPEICVVLALALHIFGVSFRPDNDDKQKLFVGDPYEVFTKWLSNALEGIGELGYDAREFGTHSFRKGITTHCGSMISGPSVIAVFLRAGWSLGLVQDRYIGYSEGGDQLCGRVVAGLNFNDGAKFTALPPHFYDANILTHEEWDYIVPGYKDYPKCFQECIPYLLVSLVHHYDWLTAKDVNGKHVNVSNKHFFFTSRVFLSDTLTRLKTELVHGVRNGRSPTGMTASGIRPSLACNVLIEALATENAFLRTLIEQNHKELLAELPAKVAFSVKESVDIIGVHQVSRQDFEQLSAVLVAQIDTIQQMQAV